jgi:hypothetical protein
MDGSAGGAGFKSERGREKAHIQSVSPRVGPRSVMATDGGSSRSMTVPSKRDTV